MRNIINRAGSQQIPSGLGRCCLPTLRGQHSFQPARTGLFRTVQNGPKLAKITVRKNDQCFDSRICVTGLSSANRFAEFACLIFVSSVHCTSDAHPWRMGNFGIWRGLSKSRRPLQTSYADDLRCSHQGIHGAKCQDMSRDATWQLEWLEYDLYDTPSQDPLSRKILLIHLHICSAIAWRFLECSIFGTGQP